jgi:hypothetical protein
MHRRCNDKSNENYGGRGISVESEWHDLDNFIADMGEPEDWQSLDRIDTNKNYCKENCKWSTDHEQSLNVRKRKDNTSGRTGVYYNEKEGKYKVMLNLNYETIYGGTFSTFEEAVAKREEMELLYHGRVRPTEYEVRPDLNTEGESY